MKKTILFLLLCSSALAQVVNAPRIPNVTIQRLRTDAVSFSVRFQLEGVNLDISGVDYKCDFIESNRSLLSLGIGTGITRPDSATLKITLTSQQVRALARESYQYRLYSTSGGNPGTRLAGNFSLVTSLYSTLPASVVPPIIVINYSNAGNTTLAGIVYSGAGTWSDIAGKPTFATVATSGNYNDLSNKPTVIAQVNSDWNAVSGTAQILNKPILSNVATSGSYNDLSNKPSLGTAALLNVAASGNAASGEVVKGNDTRLSDARSPVTHTHTSVDLTDWTTAWATRFAAQSTSGLAEGSNLYWTQARFNTAFSAKSTTDLAEGSNLYHTTARVQAIGDARYLTPATAAATYQPLGSYLTSISSSNVTTALGYTPYNATNPNNYITASAITGKLNISDTTGLLQKTTAAALYQAKGSYATLAGTQTFSGSNTFSSPLTLSSHLSMTVGSINLSNTGANITAGIFRSNTTNLIFQNSSGTEVGRFTNTGEFVNPIHIGGTGTTSTLTFRPTSGTGTTGADMIFGVGANGGTEAMRIFNGGSVSIGGSTNTGQLFQVKGTAIITGNATFSGNVLVGAGLSYYIGGYEIARGGSVHTLGGGASGLEVAHQLGTTSLMKTYSGQIAFGGGQTITTPSASAMADFQSTTKGVLLPRQTTAQINAISSPVKGLLVFNTDLNTLCFFDGTIWQKCTSTSMN